MKLVYVVLDGAAGSNSEEYTAYSLSKAEGLARISREGICGCFYPIGKGKAPESDIAVMSILGYREDLYPGRGAIEALGIGYILSPKKEIALRGNLSTVDLSSKRIIDRRVSRSIDDEEAKKLVESISYLPLRGGEAYAKVFHTVSYRVVVVIGSIYRELSANISNIDPAYKREGPFSISLESYEPYVRPCTPLTDEDATRYTCELVDEFVEKASQILDRHPVNVERETSGRPKANFILLRDAGATIASFPTFQELHGLRGAAIVDMPVEIGIARAVGIELYKLEPDSPPTKEGLTNRLRLTLSLLDKFDFVYVHLKGPDEPAHDGDCWRKKSIIEEIDKYYMTPLLEVARAEDIAVAVLSDHATPCSKRAHSSDPVPVGIYRRNLKGDGLRNFDEYECCNGSLGVIPHGSKIIGLIKEVLGERK